jgi:hypothetical protein
VSTRKKPAADKLGLGDHPLEGADPLVEHFYSPAPAAKTRASRAKGRQPLKEGKTWRLVTFSFYEDDVVRLDELVAEAQKGGHKRVSRSQIVRLALRHVNLDELPEII